MGSIVAVLIVYGVDVGYNSTTRQGLLFLLFGTFMACGAVYSWAYLPDVQRIVGNRRPGGVGGPGRIGPIGIGGIDLDPPRDIGADRSGRRVHGYGRRYGGARDGTALETKNLEDLGEGRAKARHEGEVITIRDKWNELKRRRGRRRLGSSSAAA